MDSDFVGDLDGSLLNYIEMDSLKGIPTAENLTAFPSFIENNGVGHCTSDSSSSGHSNQNGSSSGISKRRRKTVDPSKKKIRIDYKNPFHAERLNIAITAVITSLEGEPEAFHKNIMLIAKSHNIPYNTLRDNFLRARGIEPRAHRNSERKRQADALAAAAERGVVSVAKTSNLLVQTHPASVHVAGAMSRELFKESMSELSYQSQSPGVMKAAPQPPRGLALAIAMAGNATAGDAHALQIPLHANVSASTAAIIESANAPTALDAVRGMRADDDSDDSGDDDF